MNSDFYLINSKTQQLRSKIKSRKFGEKAQNLYRSLNLWLAKFPKKL